VCVTGGLHHRLISATPPACVPEQELGWDCATGNGQAAVALGGVFEHVIATDASEEQIANAEPHARVEYRVAPAENSGIDANKVDLVTIAQVLHWFDLDRFYPEARRVLKPHGVIATWAYNLLRTAPAIDAIVNYYYSNIVGAFWPAERALVENFDQLPFPFTEIATPWFEMVAQWNVEHLLGYLRTWSATQRFITANQRDPLKSIENELRSEWGGAKQLHRVVWPLTLRVGRA
jgi:SAM-dependent methyltransferase